MKKKTSTSGQSSSVQRMQVRIQASERFEVELEAAGKPAAEPADPVLLDVWTPDVEGWEPIEMIHANSRILPTITLKLSLKSRANGVRE